MDLLEDLSVVLNGFKVDDPFQDIPLILPELQPLNIPAPFFRDESSLPINVSSPDRCELSSDTLLNYIKQMLMDEDIEVNSGLQQESSAIQATEKPFYDILGEKYPASSDIFQPFLAENSESPRSGSCVTGDIGDDHYGSSHVSGSTNSVTHSDWTPSQFEYPHQSKLVSPVSTLSTDCSTPLSDSLEGSAVEVLGEKENIMGKFPEIFSKSHILQFQKGVEEGIKFLPNLNLSFNLQMSGDSKDDNKKTEELLTGSKLATDIQSDHFSPETFASNDHNKTGSSQELKKVSKLLLNSNLAGNLEKDSVSKEETYFLPLGNLIPDLQNSRAIVPSVHPVVNKANVKVERNEEVLFTEPAEVNQHNSSVRNKNRHDEDLDTEARRSNKQSAISSTSDTVRSEMFDQVLLHTEGKFFESVTKLRETMQNINEKNAKTGFTKGSTGTKSRGKRQGRREVIDLRSLLITCAQAVSTDDHRSANELLKQIRLHSTPFGDGTQRLAHYFVESLESRLDGTGSQIYSSLVTKRTSTLSILKAYHLFCAACPFKRLSHYFSNQTILDVSQNANKLHVIDFGILYGFQWPSFIQRLSARSGGPPQLRITGIDFPQPGFKPGERIEETGRRLSEYARMFNVPFQYKPIITSKWENVSIEDLELDKDEMLVANCLFRLRHLPDEMVVVDCPKDIVLNNIKKMKPAVFITGINNGAYSAPFFGTRFREAVFYFSAVFDMLEATTPRDHPERIMIEREICGREIMNIVACEGADRIERTETYKQWQVRFRRAGFVPLPLDQSMIERAKQKGCPVFHKDFMLDQDSQWLLQGWKGRILQALSKWAPGNDH